MPATPKTTPNALASDLDHVLKHTQEHWEELRGKRLFITGGTGFFGCWILESFLWANECLGLGAAAVVLTRDPGAFARRHPHLACHPAIHLHQGDVRSFEFVTENISHVIHAATPASARLNTESPSLMLDTILEGTKRTLEFARYCGAQKFLLTSSGAIYGRQPADLTFVPETYAGAPDPLLPGSAYGEGKRAAELMCVLASNQYGFEAKIARCFAFVGPYLALDIHYAIGNFIRDGLRGGPIVVSGDGSPFRSYLYASDLMVWLWTILFRGVAGKAYNVGSEQGVTVREAAQTVANAFTPTPAVKVMRQPQSGYHAERYVPSTQMAREELGLREHFMLSQAIRKTVAWHQGRTPI